MANPPPLLGLPITVLLHHLVDCSERYKPPAADQRADEVACGDSPPQEPLAAPGVLRASASDTYFGVGSVCSISVSFSLELFRSDHFRPDAFHA